MMIDSSTLLRAAGLSAIVALVALIASGVTLALFFGGAGAIWGPLNDLTTAVMLAALLLPVVAVDRLASPGSGVWLRIVTVAAIAGLTLAAVGQAALVAGVIDLETSFVTGGVGIVPFFAWLVALAVLSLGRGILPPSIGWLVVGVIALSILLTITAGLTSGPILWVASIALLAALVGWMASLGSMLMDRAPVA